MLDEIINHVQSLQRQVEVTPTFPFLYPYHLFLTITPLPLLFHSSRYLLENYRAFSVISHALFIFVFLFCKMRIQFFDPYHHLLSLFNEYTPIYATVWLFSSFYIRLFSLSELQQLLLL